MTKVELFVCGIVRTSLFSVGPIIAFEEDVLPSRDRLDMNIYTMDRVAALIVGLERQKIVLEVAFLERRDRWATSQLASTFGFVDNGTFGFHSVCRHEHGGEEGKEDKELDLHDSGGGCFRVFLSAGL
jgi:hypothetical protein